jgi:tetratricopeptide (TPR) repeat protein
MAIRRQLVEEFPDVPDYHNELATTLTGLADDVRRRDLAHARELLEEARTHHEAALQANPNSSSYREAYADNRVRLGFVLGAMHKLDAAKAAFQTAQDIRQQLADEFPQYPSYRLALADGYFDWASVLRTSGQMDEAFALYQKAMMIRREVAELYPAIPDYRQALAQRYTGLGMVLAELKRTSEAEAAFRETISIQQQLVRHFPQVPDYHGDLAISLSNLAELLLPTGATEKAQKLLAESLSHIEVALRANPKNPWYRRFHGEILANMGCTHAALGDLEKAEAQVERLKTGVSEPRFDFYYAACVFSNCVKYVLRDTKLPDSRRQELARAYGDKAMDMLRQAVQAGRKNASMILHEARLESLNEREDFKKLIAALEAQQKSASGK